MKLINMETKYKRRIDSMGRRIGTTEAWNPKKTSEKEIQVGEKTEERTRETHNFLRDIVSPNPFTVQ